jgi:uncharacterized protein (DUF1330 family)
MPIVRAAGGRYLAAGGKMLALEGEPPKRVVLHVWNSMDEVRRWWSQRHRKTCVRLGTGMASSEYLQLKVWSNKGVRSFEGLRIAV